jgi:hypothetical protein
MAVRLHTRLRRLEQKRRIERGCRACCDRQGRAALLEVRRLPDGILVPEAPEPAPCTDRGQMPERIIRVLLTEVRPPPVASALAAGAVM